MSFVLSLRPVAAFVLTACCAVNAIGLSVFVFVVLRIVWKCMNVRPGDLPGKKWEHTAAHVGHLLLYIVMVLMPLTGYLGHGRPAKLFFFIEIPRFADTWIFRTMIEGWMGLSWKQFEGPIDFMHKEGGATVVWMLIAAHASAALYHHYIRKDGGLKRMWIAR